MWTLWWWKYVNINSDGNDGKWLSWLSPPTYVNITVDGNVYCVIHAGLPSSSSRSDVNITRFMAIDLT